MGEKTAVKLINQFGSIENLLANTHQLKGAMKKKVEENMQQIRCSKFLATIKTDVPIRLQLDELKVCEPDSNELQKIFRDLEFKTLADKFLNKSEKTKKSINSPLDLFAEITDNEVEEEKKSSLKTLKDTKHQYRLVDKEEDMKNLCDFFMTSKILSLDTETTSTNAIEAELVGLSFAVSENEAFYVPIPHQRERAINIVNIFKPAYENAEITKIGQNIKYDMEVLANYGVTLQGKLFDTMIAHYLLQPELRHNMDYMAEVYLNYQTIHIDQLIGPKGKNQRSMRDLAPEEVYEYAAEDADVTLQLRNILEPQLKENGLWALFDDIEMPLVPVLADMEMNGVRIDTASLAETSRLLTNRMNDIEQHIYQLAGEPFNIASPKQVGEILFAKMKIIEKPKKTKTGQYVTSEEVLQARDSGQNTGTQGIEKTARHLCRCAAQTGQPTHRAHPHLIQPDGDCHRPPVVVRP